MPIALVLGTVYVIPVADVVRLSFSDATLLRPAESYGLSGYAAMLEARDLGVVLRNTVVFTVASVVGLQLAGLLVALLVARGDRRGLPGMTALRTIVLAAWVVPGVANGIIWQTLFSEAPFGAINSTLALIGLPRVAWLSDPEMAMVSAVLANVWQGTAFSMVVFYAARRAIDPRLYEAAEVDGARPFARFVYITLPQLKGAILVNTVLVTIQTLNTFDSILALTGGGPGRATEVLSLHIFNRVFYNYDLGGGSALALVLVAISTALTLVYIALLGRGRT
ncbi:sugar ABC transporter permease [Histidinibacterium lentulum]|uniref:Sugar ABC transporter permease n=1 Tax=Histidinibacterium lentulum TaxID=2480588 RepID=A0A3N2QSE3_9RHOB|nr:sugar ABC transporter permease [Histidinibacterium lentulum]